jgi:hypothetical protein
MISIIKGTTSHTFKHAFVRGPTPQERMEIENKIWQVPALSQNNMRGWYMKPGKQTGMMLLLKPCSN